jgi:hypothetical protein
MALPIHRRRVGQHPPLRGPKPDDRNGHGRRCGPANCDSHLHKWRARKPARRHGRPEHVPFDHRP